jgi:hypothetical protein
VYSSESLGTLAVAIYFVETNVFSRRIAALGLEEPLRELQNELLVDPCAGDTDPGTGGLRKARMRHPGRNKGKRGGARVLYLHLSAHGVIYLLFVYGKSDQATLTMREKKALKAVVESIKHEWDESP